MACFAAREGKELALLGTSLRGPVIVSGSVGKIRVDSRASSAGSVGYGIVAAFQLATIMSFLYAYGTQVLTVLKIYLEFFFFWLSKFKLDLTFESDLFIKG